MRISDWSSDVCSSDLMAATYGEQDRERGIPATVAWLTEGLGELAQAVRKGTPEQQLHELADVLAWLASLADQLGLSLKGAVARYASGCPKCGAQPCCCLATRCASPGPSSLDQSLGDLYGVAGCALSELSAREYQGTPAANNGAK